jgi:hypothetical protein
MRRVVITLFTCLSVVFISSSCSKSKLGEIGFNVNQSQDFTIPANSLLDLPLLQIPVTTNWSQTFSNNNTDKDHIDHLTLSSLTLTATGPQGQTWGYLKSVQINIVADGLPEITLASVDNIPNDAGATLPLTPTTTDLAAYGKKDNFTLNIKATQKQALGHDVQARADMTFHVVAQLIK